MAHEAFREAQGLKMKGKRIQLYLAADLVERWEQTRRYERSAEVAAALRKHWGISVAPTHEHLDEQSEGKDADTAPPTAS